MNIPFFSFDSMNAEVRSEILKKFEEFFDGGWYILGSNVLQFEAEYAAFNKVAHAVGVSNGLDALTIALNTLGVEEGDEVIIPANTYIATLLASTHVLAKPVLVEPNLNTYNLDPQKIEGAISPRTRVIMPVHLYGQACEMNKIMEIANRYKLAVVEDNAQAQGAEYLGKMTGSFGRINGTSFYPAKNIGALGDAGAVTTQNEDLAAKAKILRNYGSQRKYYNEVVGFNMRLDECQAAFLSIKLKYLNGWNEQRRQIASKYSELLSGIGDLILPETAVGASHVYHQYVIRTKYRDELQDYLNKHQIGTFIHYPVPPHLQMAYKHLGFGKGDFPIAEEIAVSCLSLPIWPGLSEENIYWVSTKIKHFFSGN